MPTGYTSAISDGISFRDFALRCARGMGACIMQKDDPMNEPPKTQEPSSYHIKALAKAEALFEEMKAMSDNDATAKAHEEYKKEIASTEESIRKNIDLLSKYRCMLKQAKDWNPPTGEHVGLKEFMISQIEESIRFDCMSDYYNNKLKTLRPVSAQEWKNERVKEALLDIARHKDEANKEKERTQNRNEWITKLYESLEIKGSATKH
jgi:hypothetical protein